MHPKIGVLPLFNSEKRIFWIDPLYFRGIERAGGMPALLSMTGEQALWDDYCEEYDGFVFTGGPDVDPAYFGQEKIPECDYQIPLRDSMELYMLKKLRALDKPILGICRGIQMINVAYGGTLYQDIPAQAPSAVIHRQKKPFELPCHQVTIARDSLLYRLVGHEHLSVNSIHHQAVWETAPGCKATAWAEDGLIEALELPGHRFCLGVQWHPEHMWQDYASGRAIWDGFVAACK